MSLSAASFLLLVIIMAVGAYLFWNKAYLRWPLLASLTAIIIAGVANGFR